MKYWGGPCDRFWSVDGDRPLSVPSDFSRFSSVEVSIRGGCVVVLSALCTLCGPGVGVGTSGLCLVAALVPATIWSVIQVTSDL